MGRRRPGSTACTGSNGSGMQFGCGARPWRYISRPLRMLGTSPIIGVSACRGQRQCAMRACDGACSLCLFGWVPCQQGHRFRPRCYCVVQCEANLACTIHGIYSFCLAFISAVSVLGLLRPGLALRFAADTNTPGFGSRRHRRAACGYGWGWDAVICTSRALMSLVTGPPCVSHERGGSYRVNMTSPHCTVGVWTCTQHIGATQRNVGTLHWHPAKHTTRCV